MDFGHDIKGPLIFRCRPNWPKSWIHTLWWCSSVSKKLEPMMELIWRNSHSGLANTANLDAQNSKKVFGFLSVFPVSIAWAVGIHRSPNFSLMHFSMTARSAFVHRLSLFPQSSPPRSASTKLDFFSTSSLKIVHFLFHCGDWRFVWIGRGFQKSRFELRGNHCAILSKRWRKQFTPHKTKCVLSWLVQWQNDHLWLYMSLFTSRDGCRLNCKNSGSLSLFWFGQKQTTRTRFKKAQETTTVHGHLKCLFWCKRSYFYLFSWKGQQIVQECIVHNKAERC